MYGKQAKIGKIDESCLEFLIGGSKIAKNLRFEALQPATVASQVAKIFKNLRLRGSKMELLIKKMFKWV